MQIFKRLDFKKKNPAQNLVEIAFIIPILVFMTLVMLEVALFWKDLNAIYALNAEINANVANLTYTGLAMGSKCPAVTEAETILIKKDSRISLNNPTYAETTPLGTQPFALYQYSSANQVPTKSGGTKPQISLWVDCRNPFENGVSTQIEFFHKTLIMKAQLPRYDGGGKDKKNQGRIIIIPEFWSIASPKVNTIRHF